MRSWLTRGLLTAGGVCMAMLLGGCAGKQGTRDAAPAARETETSGEDWSSYFSAPIEIICPWAEGGSSDVNARTIGQVVGEKTGQVVTVTNRTGGGGAVGFKEQLEAEPDGLTLGIITAELNTLPFQKTVTFNQADFYPIIRMNTLPACVAVAADAPYEDLEGLIAYAREHPGELRTGNVGMGSIWHICAAKLEREAEISLQGYSYDGAVSAAEALVNGELDMVTVETSVMHPYVESGQVKILAVMAEERLLSFPDYPTCKELGYPVVGGSFQGIVCPMDVPQEMKDKLERLFTECYQSQTYQSFCESYGLERSFLNSADFRTFLEEDYEETEKILEELGLTG